MVRKILNDELELVKTLFKDYENDLGVDLCFQGFEKELAELPGVYAEPNGCILLSESYEREIEGIVALKPLSDGSCEMKRLYIKPEFRGKGIGETLATCLIKEARFKGYKEIKLDTLSRLKPAVKLYEKLGFIKTEPYNFNPGNDVLYFKKSI